MCSIFNGALPCHPTGGQACAVSVCLVVQITHFTRSFYVTFSQISFKCITLTKNLKQVKGQNGAGVFFLFLSLTWFRIQVIIDCFQHCLYLDVSSLPGYSPCPTVLVVRLIYAKRLWGITPYLQQSHMIYVGEKAALHILKL